MIRNYNKLLTCEDAGPKGAISMQNKNFNGEVAFKVEHNYSVEIPEDMVEQIMEDMVAEFEDYEEGDDIIMDQIYNLYNSDYDDAKESALLAYAFRKNDWYGEYPCVNIIDNGYEGDDEDDENLIVRYSYGF